MTGTRYTFRSNRTSGRHGWLRLTPAYSLHAVEEILDGLEDPGRVLDPFGGTGTTALVCAERGIPSVTVDINPFLVWLARAKTDVYSPADARDVERFARAWRPSGADHWVPPITSIDRWWQPSILGELAALRHAIVTADTGERCRTLLLVAFCRTSLALSGASFRHQSMSFKPGPPGVTEPEALPTGACFRQAAAEIVASLAGSTIAHRAAVHLGDARQLAATIGTGARFQTVITSPPYPNRMSYVRELRPYMYWLGYLESGAEAGELDWRAIGGTWGKATSNLTGWRPEAALPPELAFLEPVLVAIAARCPVLARYVERYAHDMRSHIRSLAGMLEPGARVAYVAGNSRFYDVMVETERIIGALLAAAGMSGITIRPIRKRTSKRELYEYVIEARYDG